MSGAAEALGIGVSGVGGLVGALNRQAAAAGIELPMSAGRSKTGQRMWAWRPSAAAAVGVPELEAAKVGEGEPVVEVAKAEKLVEVSQPEPKPRAARKRPAREAPPAPEIEPEPESEPTRVEPGKAERSAPEPVTWEQFQVVLGDNTKAFLALVQARGRVTIKAAQDALSLPGKRFGSITGGLAKKAKSHGVELPYTTSVSVAGQRMWIWRPSVASALGFPEAVPAPNTEPAKERSGRKDVFLRKGGGKQKKG